MVLQGEQYDYVWDRVYKELGFCPNSSERNSDFPFPPFVINSKHTVYGIENTDDAKTEEKESAKK